MCGVESRVSTVLSPLSYRRVCPDSGLSRRVAVHGPRCHHAAQRQRNRRGRVSASGRVRCGAALCGARAPHLRGCPVRLPRRCHVSRVDCGGVKSCPAPLADLSIRSRAAAQGLTFWEPRLVNYPHDAGSATPAASRPRPSHCSTRPCRPLRPLTSGGASAASRREVGGAVRT